MGFSGEGYELRVRGAWLMDVNRRWQEFAGFLIPGDELPTAESLEALVHSMPSAENAAERALLKGTLLDFAFRWSALVHARFHAGRQCSCVFASLEPLGQRWRVGPLCDASVVHEWATSCGAISERLRHRQSARDLAALLIDRYHEHQALRAYAAARGEDATKLRRGFRDEFGCTPHVFLARVRVAAAMPMLAGGDKTESVALRVGYRSRKGLNKTLEKLTGLKPSDVRNLPATTIASIVERVNPCRNLRSNRS